MKFFFKVLIFCLLAILVNMVCFVILKQMPEEKLLNDIRLLHLNQAQYRAGEINDSTYVSQEVELLLKIALGGIKAEKYSFYHTLSHSAPYYQTDRFYLFGTNLYDFDTKIKTFFNQKFFHPYILCVVDTPSGQTHFPAFTFRFSDSSLNCGYTPPLNIRKKFFLLLLLGPRYCD